VVLGYQLLGAIIKINKNAAGKKKNLEATVEGRIIFST
jgi:hypothetical protein